MIYLYAIALVLIVCFGLIVLRGAPYVPSHRRQLRKAFKSLYELSSSDTLVDLGSGDGIVLAEARRCSAKVIGYELNPLLIAIAKLRFLHDEYTTVKMRDYLLLDALPDGTTVVYTFTTGRNIDAIHKKLIHWSRENELFFISYGFTIADKKPLRHQGAMYLYHYPHIANKT